MCVTQCTHLIIHHTKALKEFLLSQSRSANQSKNKRQIMECSTNCPKKGSKLGLFKEAVTKGLDHPSQKATK